jgi:SAM-dependent methyltransferase
MDWYEQFYTDRFLASVGFADEEQTTRETTFVAKVLDLPKGSRVLDLCCGFGRHARSLAANAGYDMTGYDLSSEYLAMARRDYAHPSLEFVQGDMRNLPFTEAFDAVINLFTSFGYFETDDENEQILQQVHRTLKPNGLFLLDNENKFYFVSETVKQQQQLWVEGDDGIVFLGEHDYDAVQEREIFRVHRVVNGKIEETSGYNIRLYSYPEITAMLSRQGFEIKQVWGDYDGSAFTAQSKRQIILSQKI